MLKIKWKNTDLYEPEGLNNFKTEIEDENHNWVQLIEKFCDILQVMGYYFDKDGYDVRGGFYDSETREYVPGPGK